jgi:hypothetical protein
VESRDSSENSICVDESTTYTTIQFKRYAHDVPSISIYADLMTAGSVHFDTFQTINCDCTERNCNGTFRLSFDGAVTDSISSFTNRTLIPHYLRKLPTWTTTTIKDIDYMNVSLADGAEALCKPGKHEKVEYRIRASAGNIPRMSLWSSVGADVAGNMKDAYYDVSSLGGTYDAQFYSTDIYDDSKVLYLSTNDGRDDNFDMCNGIGKCDFTTGNCVCPHGWGFHIDRGPCGRMMLNASNSNGAARCPGTVKRTKDKSGIYRVSRDQEKSRPSRIYYSSNREGAGLSRVSYHDYSSKPVPRMFGGEHTGKYETGRPLFNLTSSGSAGPVAYDAGREHLFFVDQNMNDFYIGRANVADNITMNWDYFHTNGNTWPDVPYTKWITLDAHLGEIFGLIIDPDPQQRRIYWSQPGTSGYGDGKIYWASLDDDRPRPDVFELGDVIAGPNHMVVEPRGIAIHPYENALYWVDIDIMVDRYGAHIPCIRSCRFNEARDHCREVTEIYFDAKPGNHSVTNTSMMTDMIIDFHHNNTAIVMDAGYNPAILAIPLDANNVHNPYIELDTLIKTDTRTATQTSIAVGAPLMERFASLKYLVVDDVENIVLWSDYTNMTINYAYIEARDEVTEGNTLQADLQGFQKAWSGTMFGDSPVGMAWDAGMYAKFDDGDYLECHGNGVCRGVETKFRCECFDGFTGDCSMRSCPTGRAWWHEPTMNDVAHDVETECSNMGVCDRRRGMCLCKEGFEGDACQRMTCRGRTTEENTCNGNGWCRSLKELSLIRKDEHVEYVNSDGLASIYGSREWDVSTWDANQVHGCVGSDYGYYPDAESPLHNITSAAFWNQQGSETGGVRDVRNSGNLECPFGLDLREYELYLKNGSWPTPHPGADTYNQTHAVQKVYCTANAGTFKLNFRNQTTATFTYDTTPEEATTLLNELTSIGEVGVSVDPASSVTNAVCSNVDSENHYFAVWFKTERGTIPSLTISETTLTHGVLAVLSVSPLVEGLGTMKECSGKGECNRLIGLCECWPHWGSSDGYGNIGIRNDCGFSLIA